MKVKAQRSKNLCDAAKAVLRGKFIIAIQTGNKENLKRPNLTLKQLEKEEQTKSKVSRRKEIIKNRAEINEREVRKTIEKINETKSWFFKKSTKLIYPSPASLRKKRGLKSTKLEVKKKLTMAIIEIQGILRDHYKQRYANKMDNLEEIDKFLERYNLEFLSWLSGNKSDQHP